MAFVASSGLLRSAWILAHLMPWADASEVHSCSVGAREDSEVKFRRSAQPLAARFRAIASPMPGSGQRWFFGDCLAGKDTHPAIRR